MHGATIKIQEANFFAYNFFPQLYVLNYITRQWKLTGIIKQEKVPELIC